MKKFILILYAVFNITLFLSARDCDFSKRNSRNASWDPFPSPNGKLIAFSSCQSGNHEWVMDANGEYSRQITFTSTRYTKNQ